MPRGAARENTPRFPTVPGRNAGHAEVQAGCRRGNSCHRREAKLRILDYTTAYQVATHLELRLDHQDEIRVGRGAGHQGREHERQGDEGQVRHHDFRRRRDLGRSQGADIHPIEHGYPRIGSQ